MNKIDWIKQFFYDCRACRYDPRYIRRRRMARIKNNNEIERLNAEWKHKKAGLLADEKYFEIVIFDAIMAAKFAMVASQPLPTKPLFSGEIILPMGEREGK